MLLTGMNKPVQRITQRIWGGSKPVLLDRKVRPFYRNSFARLMFPMQTHPNRPFFCITEDCGYTVSLLRGE